MNRLRLVSDPSLGLRVAASPTVSEAPVATAAPPVVMPKRREVEPELPLFSEAFTPVVLPKGRARAAVIEAPPVAPVVIEVEAPAPLEDVHLWSAPTPTFTYLAGAAGSGKTFATRQWADEEPGLLLAATTGIAAINLGGETINSVLGFFDTASLQESYINGFLTAKIGRLWKSGVRRIILDEVSMLGADQLGFLVKAIEECNNREYVLGTKKKGEEEDDGPPPAMGLTLVGDFCQLPPVRAPFAFEAAEWDRFAGNVITLQGIRRQADQGFIQMLRAARLGQGVKVAEYLLDQQMVQQETDDRFPGPTLLAKNESVDRYNALRLRQVVGAEVTFKSTRWGKQRAEWGNPTKPPETWGIPEILKLKEGALVMILANRRIGRIEEDPRSGQLLYVNGDLGELVDASEEIVRYEPTGEPVRRRVAHVRLQRTGEVASVFPVTRDVKLPCDSARRAELRKDGREDLVDGKWEIVGSITYMPIRIAYASTVHKSQGLSLDAVQVNVRDAFFKTPGMLYVALSRARTKGGLRLVGSRAAIVERCSSHPLLTNWL